jgi:ribosome-binding protein aMBF1 (putative translation factor)
MKRVTQERKRRGWSQAELARRAEMHPSSMCSIESGRLVPYPAQVEKLAAALKWPPEEAARLFEEAE